MPQRPANFRVLASAAAMLAAVAGYVNAVTIAGAWHVPSTHMTGTTTRFSVDLFSGRSVVMDVGLVVAFVIGAAVSGAVIDSTEARIGRRYGVLLVIEGGLLLVAWKLADDAVSAHLQVIALAAGLQNAMATYLSTAVVRTTHMTGILTDIGVAIGKLLSRRGVTVWRLQLYLAIFVGFVIGGACGAIAYDALEHHALLVPMGVVTVAGAGYWLSLQR